MTTCLCNTAKCFKGCYRWFVIALLLLYLRLFFLQVRNEFEAKEKQRVDKVLRGENSWVLPSVEASLRRQGEHSHKKHKKEKKSKKKKAKKRRRSSTSSSVRCSNDYNLVSIFVECCVAILRKLYHNVI